MTSGTVPGQVGADPRAATGADGEALASTPGTFGTRPVGTANASSPPMGAMDWPHHRGAPPGPRPVKCLPAQVSSAPVRKPPVPSTNSAGVPRMCQAGRGWSPPRRPRWYPVPRRAGRPGWPRAGCRARPDAGREQLGGQRGQFGLSERLIACAVLLGLAARTHLYSWKWSTPTSSRTASASSVSTASDEYRVTR